MNKINWIDKFTVTQVEQAFAFDNTEAALRNHLIDGGAFGVASGFGATKASPTSLLVEVAAGVGYTSQGERTPLDAATLDASTDENGFSTAVVGGPTNERWIAIVARYARIASDEQIIADTDPFFLKLSDGGAMFVRSASEAPIGTGARVVVAADEVLIADVLLADGQTLITTADLLTDRVHPLVFRAISDKALVTSLEQVDGTTALRIVRRFAFDAGRLPAGARVFVEAFFRVDNGGNTGTITIRRISPADDIAVFNTSSTSVSNRVRGELTIGDAAGQLKTTLTSYEVELALPAAGPTDLVECSGLDLLTR